MQARDGAPLRTVPAQDYHSVESGALSFEYQVSLSLSQKHSHNNFTVCNYRRKPTKTQRHKENIKIFVSLWFYSSGFTSNSARSRAASVLGNTRRASVSNTMVSR